MEKIVEAKDLAPKTSFIFQQFKLSNSSMQGASNLVILVFSSPWYKHFFIFFLVIMWSRDLQRAYFRFAKISENVFLIFM